MIESFLLQKTCLGNHLGLSYSGKDCTNETVAKVEMLLLEHLDVSRW